MSQSEAISILDRFQTVETDAEYHSEGEYKAFGTSRHAVSLNCISRTGNQTGIAWSLYSDARFDPVEGVVIEFTHKVVTIKGQHLLPVYHAILSNRATFIAEADRPTLRLVSQGHQTAVTTLLIKDQA